MNDKLISDFELKANHFNNCSASQCTPLDNSSKIPENQTYITNAKLSSIKFESKDINIIKSLSVDKTNGQGNIFIRMLKICDSAIIEPLSIIFNNCNKSKYVS